MNTTLNYYYVIVIRPILRTGTDFRGGSARIY